jgi:hypothetical protein
MLILIYTYKPISQRTLLPVSTQVLSGKKPFTLRSSFLLLCLNLDLLDYRMLRRDVLSCKSFHQANQGSDGYCINHSYLFV